MTIDMTLTGKSKKGIDFAPQTEIEEILQNVRTILGTAQWEVPLDRAFGIDGRIVDSPGTQKLQAEIQSAIFNALRTYEPRVEIISITMKHDEDGIIRPKIELKIKKGTSA